MSEIYEPAEDSYLLAESLTEYLTKNKVKSFLEIGCGSGVQLEVAKKMGVKNILGIDINKKAVLHCKKLGFNCKLSNLFSNISGKFDLIIFNPPYLSEDKKEPQSSKIATTGGKRGSEIINRFLRQAYKFLNRRGRILLLASSFTKGIKFDNYNKKIIATKKLFFEKLFVYELWEMNHKTQAKEEH